MKKIIYFLSLLLCCIQSNAQKDINMIISIDDDIVIGLLSGLKLVVTKANRSKETINADYYPGNLRLNESSYDMLLDTGIKAIHFVFNYTEYQSQKQLLYSYEIDLNKGWLKDYYYILRIYNTTKKKYRKMFTIPEGKEYVYEFDYPGGSTKLIRKRS